MYWVGLSCLASNQDNEISNVKSWVFPWDILMGCSVMEEVDDVSYKVELCNYKFCALKQIYFPFTKGLTFSFPIYKNN